MRGLASCLFRGHTLAMIQLTAGDLMTPDPTVLRPQDRIERAVLEMRIGGIHHLPVVDRDHHLVGLIAHRDLVSEVDLSRRVADVMRTDIKTVTPETPAHEAAYLLLRHSIGCVPVISPHQMVVGIVTETDFVRIAYTVLGGAVPVDQLEAEEAEADRV